MINMFAQDGKVKRYWCFKLYC